MGNVDLKNVKLELRDKGVGKGIFLFLGCVKREGRLIEMRKILVVCAMAFLCISPLLADFPEGNWAWITLSPDDPYARVTELSIPVDFTTHTVDQDITLHLWGKCDDHAVAGMEYVVKWDPTFITATSVELGSYFNSYMFNGTNMPGDGNPGTVDTLSAARLYAAVCMSVNNCSPVAAGEIFYAGKLTLHIHAYVETTTVTVIDTCFYPPSSHTSMCDPSGMQMAFPQWEPFRIILAYPTDVEEGSDLPTRFYMEKLNPNPFKGEALIAYGLPKDADVEISVYDALGRKVRTLVSGHVKAGRHTVKWNGLDDLGHKLTNGMYFVRFLSKDFSKIEKALLLR